MYGYKCPDCGANLDPGEKCTCQDENKKDEEGNENNMDKNEILNALKLQSELQQESMRYYYAMIDKATKNNIDASLFLGEQIKHLASLDIGTVEYIINLIRAADKFDVKPLEAILREIATLCNAVIEKGDGAEVKEDE